ncbi:MAG: lactate racemase domain-containing protein, partial [Candidatus Bathyarchaeia archaeon]
MKIPLLYGEGTIEFEIPENIAYYTVSSKLPTGNAPDQSKLIDEALNNPIGVPKLDMVLKRSDRVCILITDRTRATPNRVILPILISRIERAGIDRGNVDIIVANGLHKPMGRS